MDLGSGQTKHQTSERSAATVSRPQLPLFCPISNHTLRVTVLADDTLPPATVPDIIILTTTRKLIYVLNRKGSIDFQQAVSRTSWVRPPLLREPVCSTCYRTAFGELAGIRAMTSIIPPIAATIVEVGGQPASSAADVERQVSSFVRDRLMATSMTTIPPLLLSRGKAHGFRRRLAAFGENCHGRHRRRRQRPNAPPCITGRRCSPRITAPIEIDAQLDLLHFKVFVRPGKKSVLPLLACLSNKTIVGGTCAFVVAVNRCFFSPEPGVFQPAWARKCVNLIVRVHEYVCKHRVCMSSRWI